MSVPPSSPPPAPRVGLTLWVTRWQIAAVLVTIVALACVAAAVTGFGVVYYLNARANPAPAYRAPAYSAPDYQAPVYQAPARSNPLQPDTGQAERQACDAQRRAYAAQLQSYEARKQAQANGAPRDPFLVMDRPIMPTC
jgi:hypothetical protein